MMTAWKTNILTWRRLDPGTTTTELRSFWRVGVDLCSWKLRLSKEDKSSNILLLIQVFQRPHGSLFWCGMHRSSLVYL
jgi:hypothetical protein